ncbi:hypothetical protein YC2023_075723 [Brassica napus]
MAFQNRFKKMDSNGNRTHDKWFEPEMFGRKGGIRSTTRPKWLSRNEYETEISQI